MNSSAQPTTSPVADASPPARPAREALPLSSTARGALPETRRWLNLSLLDAWAHPPVSPSTAAPRARGGCHSDRLPPQAVREMRHGVTVGYATWGSSRVSGGDGGGWGGTRVSGYLGNVSGGSVADG